jgi:hypothetical protein
MSWRPNPRASAQTSLQRALVRFGDFADRERGELTPEQWDALVETLASWVAREAARRLDADELRERRRSA